jgi:hypothetical protein
LVNNPNITLAEATLRTAVSRAYYAAYRSLCDSETTKAGFVRGGKTRDHEMILIHLESHGRGDRAGDLRLLRRLRNQCEYDDCVPELRRRAELAIVISRLLMEESGREKAN